MSRFSVSGTLFPGSHDRSRVNLYNQEHFKVSLNPVKDNLRRIYKGSLVPLGSFDSSRFGPSDQIRDLFGSVPLDTISIYSDSLVRRRRTEKIFCP